MTRREEQIARELARIDICLPEGGHEYAEGQDGCIHCAEPFPIIARDYGRGLMPARLGDKVWVPNGTIALAGEYKNVIQVRGGGVPIRFLGLSLDDVVNADLLIADDQIIKNRYGAENCPLQTLDSFFR